MKRLLTLTLSGLFPILGLFSCSKDKPQDSWSLTEPTISSASLGQTPVTVASLQRLPADAELTFNPAEMNGSRFLITSECRSPAGVTKGRLELPATPKVSLKSLWPREIWILEDHEGLKKSACTFAFQVMHGNTVHDFTLRNVRLNNFAAAPLNTTEATARELKPETGYFGNAGDAYVERLKPLESQSSEFHFLCETYSSQTKSDEFAQRAGIRETALREMLFELAEGSSITSVGENPRYKKAVQQCRLLKISADDAGLPNYELTPNFEYRFRPPILSIAASDGFSSASATTWRNLNVFTLEIKNESDAPTAVTLPAGFGNVRLRLAGRQPSEYRPPVPVGAFFLSAKIMSESVHVSSSATRTWTTQGLRVFEVPARSSIVVSGNLNTAATCYADVNLDPSTFAASRNMGVLFGYEQKIQLMQYRDWNSDSPDFSSERIDIASNGHFPNLKDGLPTEFRPSEAYLQTIDATGAAPLFTHAYPEDWKAANDFKRRKLCWFNRATSMTMIQLPD